MCSCMFQICLKAMPMSSSVIQTGERALIMYKNMLKKKSVSEAQLRISLNSLNKCNNVLPNYVGRDTSTQKSLYSTPL